MNLLRSLFIFSLLTILVQCSKDKGSVPVLPAVPNTEPVNCSNAAGNCFRCEINGEEWVPQGSGQTIPYNISYDVNLDILDVSLRRKIGQDIFEKLYISIEKFSTNPSIRIGNGALTGFTNYQLNSTCSSQYYTSQYTSHLLILYRDNDQKIIEGTCSFILENPNCTTDSIKHISNGNFRFHY